MTAFLMLGLIYVATQAIGLLIGYKYGFVGNESKNAYDSTGGSATTAPTKVTISRSETWSTAGSRTCSSAWRPTPTIA